MYPSRGARNERLGVRTGAVLLTLTLLWMTNPAGFGHGVSTGALSFTATSSPLHGGTHSGAIVASTDPYGLAIGDTVKVIASSLNCRGTPSPTGTLISTEPNGQQGAIKNGSVTAGGYIWWQVAYTDGNTGWSAEGNGTSQWLQNVTGTPSGNSIAFNRTAALYYAAHYWNVVTSDGYFWNGPSTYISLAQGSSVVNLTGDDCAHFVSQVIGDEPHQPGGGLNIPSRVPPTYGEPGNAALGDMIINNGWGVVVSNVSSLLPGDVINYQWLSTDSTWDHIAVYVGNGTVAAHTNSHFGANWTLGGAYAYRFIHILNNTPPTPLHVSGLSASPPTVSLGSTTYLNSTVAGGVQPLTYAYSGLPQGCSSLDLASVTCTPAVAGKFNVTVTVTDYVGTVASKTTPLTVVSSSTPVLSSVVLTSSGTSVTPGGTVALTAVPVCSPSACPTGVQYGWTATPSLGHVSASGATATFVAGNVSGNVTIAVNATLNSVEKTSNTVNVAITAVVPTLSSVVLSPSNPSLLVGGTVTLDASATCRGGPCPSTVSYQWAQQTPSLGSLSNSTGTSTVFRAANTAGLDVVQLTASLGGLTRQANTSITIQSKSSPVLLQSVALSPTQPTVAVGGSVDLVATPSCSSGSCPSGVVFDWTTSNTLGGLSKVTGPSTVFSAGASAGSVTVEVQAHWNGTTVNDSAVVTITGTTAPQPSSGPLGVSPTDWLVVLLVGALVGGVAVALVVRRRRARHLEAPPAP